MRTSLDIVSSLEAWSLMAMWRGSVAREVYTRSNSFSEDTLEGGGVAIIDTKGGKGSKWDWIHRVEVCSRNGLVDGN